MKSVVLLLLACIAISFVTANESDFHPSQYFEQAIEDEVVIWSCTANAQFSHLDLGVIQKYAETATELIIRQRQNPHAFVSTSSPKVLDALRLGKTISYSPLGDFVDPGEWKGETQRLWNSCGKASAFTDVAYWACNNGQFGIHLGKQYCLWSWNEPTPAGGIEIVIKRKLDTLVPIYRCYADNKGYSLLDRDIDVKAVGRTAEKIKIYSTNFQDTDYVETTQDSYALTSLANGYTLSYKIDNTNADPQQWKGTKDSSYLWNSCGENKGFREVPYWACNNHDGIHLSLPSCRWSLSQPTPEGGITVAVKPTNPAPYRLVRIFSCQSADSREYHYSLRQIKRMARHAQGITIMSIDAPQDYVTTKSSSYALRSLRAGKSLSYTRRGGYAKTDHWEGTKVDALSNSCGSTTPFTKNVYWACNNHNGLHLTPNTCSWTSTDGVHTGGIGVYLHVNSHFVLPRVRFEESELRSSIGEPQELSSGIVFPGAIIGIVCGCVVGILFVIVAVVAVVVKNRKRDSLSGKEVAYDRMQ